MNGITLYHNYLWVQTYKYKAYAIYIALKKIIG